jgi:hypothetical protein
MVLLMVCSHKDICKHDDEAETRLQAPTALLLQAYLGG